MAGVLTSTDFPACGRLLTVADLALFPTRLPSGDVDYELDHGRLVIMAPPGGTHGSFQVSLGAELVNQGQRKGHGRAYSEVGIVLSRNPDTVVGADLAFIGRAKLPVQISREGYLETIPDLVVEIRSKNDTRAALDRKTAEYLAAGVEIILVVDPDAKTIAEHRATASPRLHRESDTLTLDPLIPGFRLNLTECFKETSD